MAAVELNVQLRILESFERSGRLAMGPTEVADAIGSNKATVSPHLRTLAEAGYLADLGAGKYALGARLYQIGHVFLSFQLADVTERAAQWRAYLDNQQAMFQTAIHQAAAGRQSADVA